MQTGMGKLTLQNWFQHIQIFLETSALPNFPACTNAVNFC